MSECTGCKYEHLSECEHPCNVCRWKLKQRGLDYFGKLSRFEPVEKEHSSNCTISSEECNKTFTNGDYEFVLDEQGNNQNKLTFTKEEQEKYGLTNMDDYFHSIDLELYMDLEAKKRIQELTEINMRLVTEKEK